MRTKRHTPHAVLTPPRPATHSYGCMSGKAPLFPWAQWVFKDLQVRGFNLRKWQTNNRKKARGLCHALRLRRLRMRAGPMYVVLLRG